MQKTKNLEKRFEKRLEEMITRMDTLEKNMNKLKELKTQHKNLAKHAQVSTAELTKQMKEYQKSKINSMKLNEKPRSEKKVQKGMNKVSKKCGTM